MDVLSCNKILEKYTIKKKSQYNKPSIQQIVKESVISFKHGLLHLRISSRNLRCEFKCRSAEIYTCEN